MEMRPPKYGYHNTDINEYFNGRKTELHNYLKDVKKEGHLVGFIGGPPCPDFSVGGKNKGRDGENGKLSLSYINLIIEMKPDFFLFENVKGLWRTARHRIFYEELKLSLREAGYCITENLTNAIDYGVPQDRDRIFLFGIRRNLLKKSSYKEGQLLNFSWDKYARYKIADIKKMSWPDVDDFNDDGQLANDYDVPEDLTLQHWFERNEVDTHPNATAYFKPRSGLDKMQTIDEGDVSKKSFKRLHRFRYSPTAAYGNNEVHLHPYKVRRLSAAEVLAIQSLPKEFEFPGNMSLSNMFKTTGNGVPFLLSRALAKTIKDYFNIIE